MLFELSLRSRISESRASKRIPGIYAIECLENGWRYIGVSNDMPARGYDHYCLLKRGKHPVAKLQEDYRKYGARKFRYVALEVTKNKDKEKYWFIQFDQGKLYNWDFPAFNEYEYIELCNAATPGGEGE